MNLQFPTTSFCPTCYREISATVHVKDDGVWLFKACPSDHHPDVLRHSAEMLERDPAFYNFIRGLQAPSIYSGYFVDVTRRCQLRCEKCLSGEAPLLKPDLSHVMIKDVKVGDVLVGFPEKGEAWRRHFKLRETVVEAIIKTISEAVEITTTHGTLICSPNHRWLANRRWRIAGLIKAGQFITKVSPVVAKPIFDDDFKKGYVAGVTLGDGTIDHRKQGPHKQWDSQYLRVALTDYDILDRVQLFALDLGVELFRKPYRANLLADVRQRCRNKRKPMEMLHISQKGAIRTIETWFNDAGTDSYRKGFVSGFFDAEGSCEQKKKTLRISQVKPNGLLDRIDGYLHSFGFKTSRDARGTRIKGGQQEVLRFFMLFDPACKRKFTLKSHNVRGKARVTMVRRLPPREMYDITTSTKTFVAYGLASHNCYYSLEKTDPAGMFSVANIVDDCLANARLAPFIFTGGEPTLHPEIETLIKEVSQIGAAGTVELLTNGVKLAEPAFYDAIMPLITNLGVANLNLSLHLKETDKWKTVIEQCRKDRAKIESALIVIDSRDSFMEAVLLADSMKDVVMGFRIKAATRLWAEQKPLAEGRIFCSDMLRWLQEGGYEPQFVFNGRQNKVVFINLLCKGGLFLMPVAWNDVANVDLQHINCAPYYRARNGEVCNFVTASLINEGMEKGWLGGQRMGRNGKNGNDEDATIPSHP